MAKIDQIEKYIAYQKTTDKSKMTLASYRSDLMQFARWFQKVNNDEVRLHKITPTDFRQYKQFLISSQFKPQTINRRLLSLKYFLEWGRDTKKIKYSFPYPKTVKQNTSKLRWIDKNRQHRLLRHMEEHASLRDKEIVRILLNTGLRIQELCNLKWAHVTTSDRKGKLIVYGKGQKYREVPLNKDSRNALDALGYKDKADKADFIFIGQRGTLTPRGIQLMVHRALKNTEFKDISPHQLRHSFCKNLVDAGVSLEKVAMLAGHARLDTTKLYCKPSFDDLTEAVEKIGEAE